MEIHPRLPVHIQLLLKDLFTLGAILLFLAIIGWLLWAGIRWLVLAG